MPQHLIQPGRVIKQLEVSLSNRSENRDDEIADFGFEVPVAFPFKVRFNVRTLPSRQGLENCEKVFYPWCGLLKMGFTARICHRFHNRPAIEVGRISQADRVTLSSVRQALAHLD